MVDTQKEDRRVRATKSPAIRYLNPKDLLPEALLPKRCGLYIELHKGPIIGPFCCMIQESRFLHFMVADGAKYEFKGDSQIEFDSERYGDFTVHHGLPVSLRDRYLALEKTLLHMNTV